MASINSIVAIVLGVAIAAILIGPANSAVVTHSGTQTVTNETVTANVGNYTALDGYQLVSGSETVYGYNDTSSSYEQLTSGTDYTIKETPGKIKVLSSSTIVQDGEQIKVSYDYQATQGITTTILGYGPEFLALLLLAVLGGAIGDSL